MITSSRMRATSSGVISGSGLAMAKMMGLGAMERIIASVNAPLADRPNTAAAPAGADAGGRAWGVEGGGAEWAEPRRRARALGRQAEHRVGPVEGIGQGAGGGFRRMGGF